MTPSSTSAEPDPASSLDIEEGEGWAFALLTAAHHDMDDYLEMSRNAPPGGIASLVALNLALLDEYGKTQGMTREQVLKAFTLIMEPSNFLSEEA